MAIPVLLAVASLTFFLVKLAPGGPFDADKAVSPQVLKNLNEAYNLNATEWEQYICLLYTSPSPRDATLSRMPSSA